MSLFVRRLALVQIKHTTRHDDGRITLLGSLQALLYPSPTGHHGCGRQETTIYSLIPYHRLLVVLGQHIRYPIDKVLFQLGCILQSFLLHELLTIGTFLPPLEAHFIATYVNIFRREDFDHLLDDVLYQLIIAFFRHTPHISQVHSVGV